LNDEASSRLIITFDLLFNYRYARQLDLAINLAVPQPLNIDPKPTRPTTMESLVASLNSRPPHLLHDNAEDNEHEGDASLAQWGSSGGFGNLMGNGVVRGMEMPRVPDVSRGEQKWEAE
jgi:hypothetical protein